MKTLREMMDLIESAQPVDLRARAAELAIQILKNAHMDDDSEQGYIRVDPNALFQFHVLMNTAKKQGVAEASFTAAASMHAATRKRDPQPQDPKHDFRVGDDVVTKKGSKPGKVVFVDGEKIHVKGTNPYYPDHITHHTASELKKGVAEDQIEETEVDPVRRIEELFRDK